MGLANVMRMVFVAIKREIKSHEIILYRACP